MEQGSLRPAAWTVGGLSSVVLLALAWLGTTLWGLSATAQAPLTETALAAVQVLVTDGSDARLWLERSGAPPRALPLCCEVPPGPVALRVARRTAEGDWRQDTLEVDLQAGRLHLVPIGGQPVRIQAREGEQPLRELPWRYPFPGVVSRPADAFEAGVLGLGGPQQVPMPVSTALLQEPDLEAGDGYLPARERLLVVANPFLHEIRCELAASHADKSLDWRQEGTLPAFACRVFALGAASSVRVACARADDGAALGESRYTLPAGAGRAVLYTPGGATRYAWLGSVEGWMPPVPVGEWAELPAGLNVRLRRSYDPAPWLLAAAGPGGADVGLAPMASAPMAALRAVSSVQARTDVVARVLALPPELQDKPVSAVSSAGAELLGLVDGVVHDLRTGRALHAAEAPSVVQMQATPHGLVLLTGSGRLATLADGRLVLGPSVHDPTLRLAPASGDPPAVWLYGGALEPTLMLQPLDGSPPSRQARSEQGEERAVELTAMTLASGAGVLVASGRRIERLQPHPDQPDIWSLESVLTLPEGEPDIVGLLDLDGRLIFASEHCVYELRGNLVLPLAEGIGGPLVSWGGGVVVSDARSARLYHLSGPAFPAQQGGLR